MMKSLHIAFRFFLCGACLTIVAVARSTAQTEYWETVSSPFGIGDGDLITAMAVDDDGTIYGVSQFEVLVRSNDLGTTWENIWLGARGFRIAVAPEGALYVASDKGVYKSTDKGETWEVVSTTPEEPHFVQDVLVHSSGNLYATMPGVGILRSSDQGASWEQVFDGDAQYLTEVPNGHLFSTSGDANGVYRSTDGGSSWSPAGLPDTYSTQIGTTELGTLLLATWAEGGHGRIYRSENEGGSWNSTTLADGVQGFTSIPGEAIYAAAANSGVWRSSDDGRTWSSFSTGLTDTRVLTVLYHPDGYLFTTNYFGQIFRRSVPKSSAVPGDREELDGAGSTQSPMLSPNPARDRFTLSFHAMRAGEYQVSLIDPMGRRVQMLLRTTLTEGDHAHDFDVTGLPDGLYHIRIESSEGVVTAPIVLHR